MIECVKKRIAAAGLCGRIKAHQTDAQDLRAWQVSLVALLLQPLSLLRGGVMVLWVMERRTPILCF